MSLVNQAALFGFIRHLASAVTTAAIYPLEHRQVVHLCQETLKSALQAIDDGVELSLLRVDDQMVLQGRPLGGGMYPVRLAHMLKLKGIGHLKITRYVDLKEMTALVSQLAHKSKGRQVIQSSENIRLGKVELRLRDRRDEAAEKSLIQRRQESEDVPPELRDLSRPQLDRLAEIFEAAERQKRISSVGIGEIVTAFINAFAQEASPLLALAPLRQMDEYTFTHSINVCILNLAQAAALGIDGALLHDVGVAALLHDVGKLQIPKEILLKTEPLTDEDWQHIRRHPMEGAKFLLAAAGVPRLAVVTAYEHHLHFDHSGYPGLGQGVKQNISSQMTTISDIFDAMSTDRAYRAAESLETVAVSIKYLAGNKLHPLLTENFLQMLTHARTGLEIDW